MAQGGPRDGLTSSQNPQGDFIPSATQPWGRVGVIPTSPTACLYPARADPQPVRVVRGMVGSTPSPGPGILTALRCVLI